MQHHSSERETTSAPENLRERIQADPELDENIVSRWREASPAEHGRALWGLLEFAELVQGGKDLVQPPEPMASLPTPFAERDVR